MKSNAGYRVGIVNPLTLVGNEIKTILRERAFPFATVVLLDSTGKAAGALTEIGNEPAVVLPITDDELEDLDLVFFCGPAAGNKEWIEHHREDRFTVVDVSRRFRRDSHPRLQRVRSRSSRAAKRRRL